MQLEPKQTTMLGDIVCSWYYYISMITLSLLLLFIKSYIDISILIIFIPTLVAILTFAILAIGFIISCLVFVKNGYK